MRLTLLPAALVLAACTTAADNPAPLDLSQFEMVDLSHGYGPDTVYWPTETEGFQRRTLIEGELADGQFVSAFAFSTPEHAGTHMDAPYHFNRDGAKADAVPIERLIAPAVVIDITGKAAAETDYALTVADIAAHEASYGKIAPGSIILLRTGWSARWAEGAGAYLGGDDPADLHFPSFGAEAARFLIEECGAAALGVDAASTDIGPATDFPVHRLLGAANVPGFENLGDLGPLPATGAYLIALPMKIEGGSGGPLRAVALVPN
ncbi:MAG: cyclase family protein [Parvularculaceae bacterium]